MNDNRFYVYAHFKGDVQKDMFYVGKGSDNRIHIKSNRSLHWKNVVKKHGYNVLKLHENLSETEAMNFEISLIALYRAMGHNLVNKTNGGEGASGRVYVPTAEAIQKNKDSHRGPRPERQGVPLSTHHCKSLSDAHLGQPSGMKNKKHKEESRQKMRESHKNRKNDPIKNAQISITLSQKWKITDSEGNIEIFCGANAASDRIGITRNTVYACARSKKSSKGFFIEKYSDSLV
jgi:hypothetical protein